MGHTKLTPSQSKLLTNSPLYANQNDVLSLQKMIRGDQRHVQKIYSAGKLYGPVSQEDQLEAIQYAYGIRGVIPK